MRLLKVLEQTLAHPFEFTMRSVSVKLFVPVVTLTLGPLVEPLIELPVPEMDHA